MPRAGTETTKPRQSKYMYSLFSGDVLCLYMDHSPSHIFNKNNVIFCHDLCNYLCLFVCLNGRPCGTRLGPGGPDSSKSSSQAKKPI